MVVNNVTGSILAGVEFDSVSRTFDANTPPRPLVETYKLGSQIVAVVTNTYTNSGTGAGTVPTTSVRSPS